VRTGALATRPPEAAASRGPVAVVIEDDPDLQLLVRLVLERHGWSLVPAATVAEGLAATRAVDPDAVVLDLGLPDRPGLDVLAELQADPATSWIPVVVLSGDSAPATTSRALLSGAQDFIAKPFAADELHARLTAALRVSTAHRAIRASDAAHRGLAEGLREAEERYRLTFEEAPIGVALVDPSGRFLRVNRALSEIVGYDADQLLDMSFQEITCTEDLQADVQLLHQLLDGDIERYQLDKRYVHAKGHLVWVQLNVSLVRDADGVPEHLVVHIEDITDLYAAKELLVHRSLHDPLTGLPNRLLLHDRLEQAMARDSRSALGFALLFVDLDRFKVVNDSLGHDVGDAMLIEVSRRLSAAVREGDTVARLGGDEFIVLADGISEVGGAGELAERVRHALAEPIEVPGGTVVCTASIGVSLPVPGQAPRELLREADTAMYRAKERGKDRVEVFDDALRVRAVERLQVEQLVRRALNEGGLVVHYQPIIDVASGRVVAAEALARVEVDGRVLHPDDFLAVAEDSGLIAPLGELVMREAITTAAGMKADHPDFRGISVNVAARQFDSGGFVDSLSEALDEAQLEPDALWLELTEHSLLVAAHSGLHTLDRVRDLGVRIAIDDFGTGYSSLTYLREYPIDLVKIDRSFVSGLPADNGDVSIVNAVIGLSQSLGLWVVAEGVEHPSQLRHLREQGCTGAQGYLFARPLELDALDEVLTLDDRW
jgi:diguanylate cyclase (GGDEF)-like protein/PAS domain S-box-containing protein